MGEPLSVDWKVWGSFMRGRESGDRLSKLKDVIWP